MKGDEAFWSISAEQLLGHLETPPDGLAPEEAARRLAEYGPNRLRAASRQADMLSLFLAQLTSPITLILIFSACLSAFLKDRTDALIILGIVLASAALGFWQERGAARAMERLLRLIKTTATVFRGGRSFEVPVDEIVPGDLVDLSAGANIPGDCLLIAATDLFVDEAALTGESFPAEKRPGILSPETPLAGRTNALFLGSHVISGTARAVVVRTGRRTEFGAIAEHLRGRVPETEFERGVRSFGYFLAELTLLLIVAIFAVNVALERPVLDSFLFSLALAVGLTPQLLPAIIGVNLAHGARQMAERGVIVRRLASIENFGSMDVLCTDKTGTLTQGVAAIHSAVDARGQPSDKAALYAFLNASFESGFANPIDAAIRDHYRFDLSGYRKLDEVPYDFLRRRLSILVETGGERLLVTKGAVPNVLAVCTAAELADGTQLPFEEIRACIERQFEDVCQQGFRALAVAAKTCEGAGPLAAEQEADMVFLGLLALRDPVKLDIAATIDGLRAAGIELKMITGDHALVARSVAGQIGLRQRLLTGADLSRMSDAALVPNVAEADVFAEVEPNQKERIILALRKGGHVVGYLGDGINDASALHAADVGISVDQAVDVAKEAADIVLLRPDLSVLAQGVQEGRTTFANTLKYVFMATSANFGNMFSMAGASLFLPFLPMLPKQVLLTNLLTDFPEMTIATDNVDPEAVARPRRWNIAQIRKFMLAFGTLSSVFDYLTFLALWFWLQAGVDEFRSGWFVESVASASLIVLVIRTTRPVFQSRPASPLCVATLLVLLTAVALPFSPAASALGMTPLPFRFLGVLVAILAAYVVSAELLKAYFFGRRPS